MIKDLLEKYEAKLQEFQAEFDEAYESQYTERCDELDEVIELCTEIIEDLKG